MLQVYWKLAHHEPYHITPADHTAQHVPVNESNFSSQRLPNLSAISAAAN